MRNATFDIDSSTWGRREDLNEGGRPGLRGVDSEELHALLVSVSDGMNDYSITDTVVDDSIDVTINVEDLNEKPAFDGRTRALPTLEVEENTAADTDIGRAVPGNGPGPEP